MTTLSQISNLHDLWVDGLWCTYFAAGLLKQIPACVRGPPVTLGSYCPSHTWKLLFIGFIIIAAALWEACCCWSSSLSSWLSQREEVLQEKLFFLWTPPLLFFSFPLYYRCVFMEWEQGRAGIKLKCRVSPCQCICAFLCIHSHLRQTSVHTSVQVAEVLGFFWIQIKLCILSPMCSYAASMLCLKMSCFLMAACFEVYS